ncbi:hypothetical protein BpHYR1_009046 [Brachionus plicatilis]|uniref:Uncharacterized protein n=1 Tax=Brachionus plicatilis TaxID=10195 RepID=A0A3M7SV36_BRAPC|nr:hypothetical protein BpHYR1_009046 [Brachionus plicatilis]
MGKSSDLCGVFPSSLNSSKLYSPPKPFRLNRVPTSGNDRGPGMSLLLMNTATKVRREKEGFVQSRNFLLCKIEQASLLSLQIWHRLLYFLSSHILEKTLLACCQFVWTWCSTFLSTWLLVRFSTPGNVASAYDEASGMPTLQVALN